LRADSSESESPIDLPLHDRAPVVEEASPLRGTVEAAERISSPSRGGRGIVVGMLVLGLLAGFGAGFVVGQRLAPPSPPRAVEVPRPAPVVEPVAPVAPVLEPPVAPAQNFTEAPVVEEPVEVKEPEVQAPPPEPRTTNQQRRIPDPGPRIPASRPATIRFDSRPPGATIYLDDVRIGVTPLTMNEVTPGTHQVRMEMLGHDTWRTSVTVKDGEQFFVGGSLE
jgi:hypothetical protein